jgi:CRP-like cAMP-binding protein
MSARVAAPAAATRSVDVTDATIDSFRRPDADRRCKDAWSPDRLAAAVAITRPARPATPFNDLLSDELEFFTAIGTRHNVRHGVVFVRRGEPIRDVYLVARGAVAAVVPESAGRRPIVGLALPDEMCCAIPALLDEPAAWDGVTVTDSSLISIPADRFNAAVRDGWTDRWATRALWWLAEFGARANEFDGSDLPSEVAALLLRHRNLHQVGDCTRALADVLDVSSDAVEQVLVDLRRYGAIRVGGGGVVSVAYPDRLHGVVRAARRLHAALAPS